MAGIVRRIIATTKAAKPAGPYNQAVVVDKTIYVSGQLGLEPETGKLVDGGASAQAEMALKNTQAILEAAGSSMSNVVKMTILLNDIKDWPAVNEVYTKFFTSNFPARAAYQVAALPLGGLVEMESIAILGKVVDVE